jgi:hypothetical protein
MKLQESFFARFFLARARFHFANPVTLPLVVSCAEPTTVAPVLCPWVWIINVGARGDCHANSVFLKLKEKTEFS